MNNKNVKSRIKHTIMPFSAILVVLFSISAFADADERGEFKFRITGYWGNGQVTESKYRDTDNIQNQWEVEFLESTEGDWTYTDFWLEDDDGTNVSDDLRVQQGSGPVCQSPFESASYIDVYLTGENNNWNSRQYTVSGNWDEETWD